MTSGSRATEVALGDGASTVLECWGERGPVLLGVHGLTSSRKSWARFAERFAGSHRVFAYDQRGHGDAAGVTGPMTLERSLRDLEAVVAAIGGEVRALLGHSWGGAVVLAGGRRIPCARVVAIDPFIRKAPGTWHADLVAELRPLFATDGEERARLVRAAQAALPPIEVEAKVHALRRMTLAPIVAFGDENGIDQGRWDLRETVRAYPKPLLLLLADPAQSIVAPEDADFVRRHAGPNVQLEVFAGEGHSLQRTAFERFAGLVERFIER
jgi:pimeloyl-ACP methyl ester carboxylesterase